MKKLLTVLFAFTVMFLFASCASNTKTPTDSSGSENSEARKTGSGFSFVYKNVSITMNAPAAPIIEKLGEPLSYFEAASCAFKGLDKTYTYSGIQLLTYPLNDADYVYSVVLMDDTVSTPEGVSLGNTLESIKTAYGENCVQENNKFTYTKGDSTLSFFIEKDMISSIEYDAITK